MQAHFQETGHIRYGGKMKNDGISDLILSVTLQVKGPVDQIVTLLEYGVKSEPKYAPVLEAYKGVQENYAKAIKALKEM
jgi:hypothetical protein